MLTLNRSILLLIAALFSSPIAFAGPLYQWVDADGVITYSPDPPSASVTKDFKEISSELGNNNIEVTPEKRAAQKAKVDTPQPHEPIGRLKNESKIERMARLAPKPNHAEPTEWKAPVTPVKQSAPINLDEIKHQRKCTDLVNRITALETRLSVVESAKQLNESMLLLARYQTMHENSCR